MRVAPARSMRARSDGSLRRYAWSSTACRPVGMRAAQLVGVDAGMQEDLGDARPQVEEDPLDPPARADGADHEVVGEHDAFLVCEAPEREADRAARRSRPPCAAGARSRPPSRGTRRRSRRAVGAFPCGCRGGSRRSPSRIARSICARHSWRTSSRSAWSHVSSTVRGKPPSPSSRLGECVIGPQRYVSHSEFRVRCTPTSSPRYMRGGVAGPRARDHQRGAGRDAVAQRVVDARRSPTRRSRGRRS